MVPTDGPRPQLIDMFLQQALLGSHLHITVSVLEFAIVLHILHVVVLVGEQSTFMGELLHSAG
jgi:hypothetical protein